MIVLLFVLVPALMWLTHQETRHTWSTKPTLWYYRLSLSLLFELFAQAGKSRLFAFTNLIYLFMNPLLSMLFLLKNSFSSSCGQHYSYFFWECFIDRWDIKKSRRYRDFILKFTNGGLILLAMLRRLYVSCNSKKVQWASLLQFWYTESKGMGKCFMWTLCPMAISASFARIVLWRWCRGPSTCSRASLVRNVRKLVRCQYHQSLLPLFEIIAWAR